MINPIRLITLSTVSYGKLTWGLAITRFSELGPKSDDLLSYFATKEEIMSLKIG